MKIKTVPHVTGVEIPLLDSKFSNDYTISYYQKLKKILDELNLKRKTITVIPKSKDITSNSKETVKKGMDHLKKCIDFTALLGATELSGPIVFPFLDRPKIDGKELECDRLKQYIQDGTIKVVPRLREIADYAADKNIKITVEYLNHWETIFPNTLQQTFLLVSKINRSNVGILVDTAHEVMNGQGPKMFDKTIDILHKLKVPLSLQLSEPQRGDLTNTWLPFQILNSFKRRKINTPLILEIFDCNAPFSNDFRLNRTSFKDPIDVIRRSAKLTIDMF